MATVPTYKETVQSRPVSTVYQRTEGATLDVFGGAQARSMIEGGANISRIGDRVGNIALKQQIEDNEREAKDLDNELARANRAITLGDGTDENPGYFNKKGEDAIKSRKATQEAIEKARKDLIDKASNSRVKEMFGLTSARRVEDEFSRVEQHFGRERRVANTLTDKARATEAADDAAAGWNDPNMVNRSVVVARDAAMNIAERDGYSPEAAASLVGEFQTEIYAKAIGAALEANPSAAAALYKEHKNKIDGRARPAIEKALEAATLREQSQAETKRIMDTGMSESAALAEARKIRDPKVQDEVVTRLHQRFAENDRAERMADKALSKSAWDHLLKGGSSDELSASQLLALGQQVSSVRQFELNRARDGRGFAPHFDPDTDRKLHMLYMEDKAAFAEYDLNQDIGKLDEQKWTYWSALQRSVNRKEESEAKKAPSYALATRIATEYLRGINISPNDEGAKGRQAQQVLELGRKMVEDAYAAGKTVTSEELNKGYKELFLQGEIPGGGRLGIFSADKRYFQVKGTPAEKQFVLTNAADQADKISAVTGVPQQHIEAIAKSLKKKKQSVTLENIERAWKQANGG